MSRRRVAILTGGRSSEHEIALASARSVVEALDPERYEVVTVEIGRDGTWSLPSGSSPAALGPGSDGKFQRGQPEKLADAYEFSARYHTAHIANIPGPGALPPALAYKPFSLTLMLGLTLPASRQADYVCASGTYREDVTITLPPAAAVTTLPPSKSYAAEGAAMDVSYESPSPNIIKQRVVLKLDRPAPVCSAAAYAKVRPQLAQMVSALSAQILYK